MNLSRKKLKVTRKTIYVFSNQSTVKFGDPISDPITVTIATINTSLNFNLKD